MKKCKGCGREEWGFLSVLNEDGYCQFCATKNYNELIKKIEKFEQQREKAIALIKDGRFVEALQELDDGN